MHLYLAHYVTNEILAAALATAALYLFLFASSEERDAARITICVARIGDGRGNVSKSDRNFVAADRNCCNRR